MFMFIGGWFAMEIPFVRQHAHYFGFLWLVPWGLYYLFVPKKDRRTGSVRILLAGLPADLARELYMTGIPARDVAFGAAAVRLSRETVVLRIVTISCFAFAYIVGLGAIIKAPAAWFLIQFIVIVPTAFLFMYQIDRIFIYIRTMSLVRFLIEHGKGSRAKIRHSIRAGRGLVLIWIGLSIAFVFIFMLSIIGGWAVVALIASALIFVTAAVCVTHLTLTAEAYETRMIAFYTGLMEAAGREEEEIDLDEMMKRVEGEKAG
jgi:hypothetical protein